MDTHATGAFRVASCCIEFVRKHSGRQSSLRAGSEFLPGKTHQPEGLRRTEQLFKRLLVCFEQGPGSKPKGRRPKITAEEGSPHTQKGYTPVLRRPRRLGEGKNRRLGF